MTFNWTYQAPENDQVDPEYQLEGTNFSVQDCRAYGGGFLVVESGCEEPGNLKTFWVRECGAFAKLDHAKAYAQGLARRAAINA